MRKVIRINDNWFFSKENPEVLTEVPSGWESVQLPHCWNKYDGQDGGADYYKGKCWYIKELEAFTLKPKSRVYIEIHAASNVADVYVNGVEVTSHEGGFSIFRADITDALSFDFTKKNTIAVAVDNSDKSNVYPQMADFTFYGGLYRNVNLIVVNESHFDLDYYGAPGITVSSKVHGDDAVVTLHGFVKNAQAIDRVEFEILDREGRKVAYGVRPALEDTSIALNITDVHLWQGVKDPYLYEVFARLIRGNEVQDEVSTRLGVREFYVDPEKGFFLNGESMPLRGVSRHQDKLDIGNALRYEDHLQDAWIIRDLGANTIRLAHYQHSQDFYDICDEMGFVVWAEIPFISAMSSDPAAHQNCISQMKELIYQNYNHPSICFWGISNEITIGGDVDGLCDNLKDLNRIVHELDDTRLSTMAQVSSLPKTSEHNQITDVLSYNHYFGWYQGVLEDNEKWLDSFHEMYPTRALGISEYGCEGITTYHNDDPKGGDYSEEYQALYHEHMAKVIEERPYLWATHIWNMFDFGCDARDEGGVKGRNNKGLVTIDRKIKKDSFYLYKAYWSENKFVHICSKRYAQRTDEEISLKVYTNCNKVALYEGETLLEEKEGNKVIVFEHVKLKDGFNTFTVKQEELELIDTIVLEKVDSPNETYIYVDNVKTGVTNWFDHVDFAQVKEMEFKEGYYSVKDKVSEILKNEEAADIIINGLSSIMGMKLKASMLNVMGSKPVNELGGMAGEVKAGAMEYINEQLQKIKK